MQRETAGFVAFARARPLPTVGITLGGSCIALGYNMTIMQSVRSLSAIGTAVLGNFRTVFLIFMSAVKEASAEEAKRACTCMHRDGRPARRPLAARALLSHANVPPPV